MRLSTSQFDVNAERKSFVEEHSSLGNQDWTQIYPDACDAGVILTSHLTGQESSWYMSHTDYTDGSNSNNSTQYINGERKDIAGWNLVPTPESIRKHPRLKGWTMLIIND